MNFVKKSLRGLARCPMPFFTFSLTTPFLNITPPLTTLFCAITFLFLFCALQPTIFVCDRCGQDSHLGLCGKPGACRKEDAPPPEDLLGRVDPEDVPRLFQRLPTSWN
ncbi:hypothetical protein CDAR_58171 [Caerostris darwini]|uniref:Secreted protein n=1 Tax=Caerostris darwini TaxID=1538125 RepID=A0AAV4U738_9ARAC|nr:hypothetical protein CDAR_58171 [Caerostris darwini]